MIDHITTLLDSAWSSPIISVIATVFIVTLAVILLYHLPIVYIENRWYQYAKVGLSIQISVLILYRAASTQEPIIVGSLLGIFPTIIIGLNSHWKKPHVVIKDVKVT
ncbi:hypothetical protein, partial [Natrinema sp. JCM 9743]